MRPEEGVRIHVDASRWISELPHNWNYIGYDEINYTYTPEGQALLAKFQALQDKPYYVRVHHLLCTGNCHGFYKWGSTNAYIERDGQPIYDWTIVDLVFDTLLKHNCKPFVELGFMPQHLADPAYYKVEDDDWIHRNYRAYGFASPPKDYQKWYDLIYSLVQHCVERYGEAEIASWYWELWNEPDLRYYWAGSIEDFNKLYDYTVAAVKAASPTARVGGPGTTNPKHDGYSGQFLDAFLDHCVNGMNTFTDEQGTPLDFLSFHVKGGGYRADPLHMKQAPPSVKRIVEDTRTGYEIISKYPSLTGLECILSEIDPDGWAAGGAWDNANLNFRNTPYYPSFVVTAFDQLTRFAQANKWDLRFLSWAFLFVGERCFEGTRSFSTQGIDKAILNLFRMYGKLGHQGVAFASSRAQDPALYADMNGNRMPSHVSGMATLRGNNALTILVYNHHDDWDRNNSDQINLSIANLPFEAETLVLRHYRIDGQHSNAYQEWLAQDQPMYPADNQYQAIKQRDGLELLEAPKIISNESHINLNFELPVHGISLIELSAP
ncbi:MAG: beta-xylosidase [Anaerolineae bacterium]|nr:beta-xylosidase [Anaerolineae bacterium]